MEIKSAGRAEKEIFNKFVLENNGSFLQSFEWGEFQEKAGKKIFRLAHATLILFPLPFKKSYLYCPRGPLISGLAAKPAEIFAALLEEIKKIAEKENAVFLKIEPDENFPLSAGELAGFGFEKSKKEIQPSETLILDLTKDEETLLAEMKEKTRYNIRLAEKRGVKIGESADGFAKFWELLEETAGRDGFSSHPKDYYEKMLETKTADFENKLFLAEKNGEILAGSLVNFFGGPASGRAGRATYLHGASSGKSRNLMAPHLLHWEIIKSAKREGFKEYDFWGISEKKYPGVTRFKRGFGGEEIKYPGAYDLPFDKFWHIIYRAAQKLR